MIWRMTTFYLIVQVRKLSDIYSQIIVEGNTIVIARSRAECVMLHTNKNLVTHTYSYEDVISRFR